MPSHIALNAQLLSLSQSYRTAGISWYIANLLKNLGHISAEMQFTALLHEPDFRVDSLPLRRTRWPTHRPPVRILWEQLVQPLVLQQLKPDLLHAMAFVSPIVAPCPQVVTVYDLSFLRYPETFRPFNRWYLKYFTAYSVKRAQAVIAISESTRQDVINLLGKPAEQVHTVYCGADGSFQPLPEPAVTAFKIKHGLPETFILYLGTLEPRKNVDGLIEAYALWCKRERQAPPLVVAGGKGWFYQTIFERVEALGLTERVFFPGYVPQAELPLWYNAASLFVYPSRFEGFGLPVLEAMACGTPVITSNVSALPEVAGDAGVLVDPNRPAQLADMLARVMADQDKQAAMGEAGLVQATQFRWDKAAHETVAVYQHLLNPSPTDRSES